MRYERADFEWTAISPQDGFQPTNVRPSSTSEGGRRHRRSGANRLERGSLLVSRPRIISRCSQFRVRGQAVTTGPGVDTRRSFGLRPQTNLLNAIKLMLSVQSRPQKYSRFRHPQISATNTASHPSRGALAIVTNVGMGCGGRGSVGRAGVIAGLAFGLRERSAGAQDERRCSPASQKTSAGVHYPAKLLFARTGRVRQNRVVLAPVAGVKSAEILSGPTGSCKTVESADDGDKTNSSPGRARHKP